jgi:hypothetical protein
MVHHDYALACVQDATMAWNCRDWTSFESLHSCDVIYESPHHAPVIGRGAVVRRYQDLVAAVTDLHSSEPRMIENDRAGHYAAFEYVQTGTLADARATDEDVRLHGLPFTVHTTMFVRFDDDGRIAVLRTLHR